MGTHKPKFAISSVKGGVKSRTSASVQCQPRRLSNTYLTGNETSLQHWEPDTEKESMQWNHPGSTAPKEFCTQTPTR